MLISVAPTGHNRDRFDTRLSGPRQPQFAKAHLERYGHEVPQGTARARFVLDRSAAGGHPPTVMRIGWEAGIRTPINRSRVCRVTVTPPPSEAGQRPSQSIACGSEPGLA